MILQWHQSDKPPPPFPDACPACGSVVQAPQKYGVPGAEINEQWAAECTNGHIVAPAILEVDEGLIAQLTQRRDALRAERIRKEQAGEQEPLVLKARHGKRQRYAEAHASSPVQLRIVPPIDPMPSEYRCPVTHRVVKPLAVLPAERRGQLQVIWWYCSACDRNKRTKSERLFSREKPAPHPLILATDTPPPPVLVSGTVQKRVLEAWHGHI